MIMAKKNHKANFTPSTGAIAWGLVYLVFQYLVLPELLHYANGLLPHPLGASRLNLCYYILNFLAAVLIFGKYLGNHLSALGRNWWACLKALILGYVFYYVTSYAVSWCLPRLIPGFANVNDGAIAAMAAGDFWAVALGTVILVPVTEELFYRGLIFGSLYQHSKGWAYAASCLVFSAIHVVGYIGGANPLVLLGCFVQYLPAGLCLAWSFQASGSIFVPIAIHALVNALSIFAMR